MIALAVDDEHFMLEMLLDAIEQSPDIDFVQPFSTCTSALNWAMEHPIDVAFLDINMRGMGGIELAKQIQSVQPNCKIVFCTAHSEYAIEAFHIHVSGYLMKPITASAVQFEIDHIKQRKSFDKCLCVNCFGHFEVQSYDGPLRFKRTKTKELFAFLVDRQGSGVTAKEICAVLWEDDLLGDNHMNYFWQLLDDLRHTLKGVNADAVLVKQGKCYAIDVNLLDCDYYQYLETGRPEFRGEYMLQYSWAEETAGALY